MIIFGSFGLGYQFALDHRAKENNAAPRSSQNQFEDMRLGFSCGAAAMMTVIRLNPDVATQNGHDQETAAEAWWAMRRNDGLFPRSVIMKFTTNHETTMVFRFPGETN